MRDRFGGSPSPWSDKKKTPTNKLNKGNSVIGASLNLMFYLILISAILFVSFSGVYSPDGRPRALAGYSIMRVATGSMVPELPINTLIVTREVDPAVLREGEIVTFLKADDTTVTHRVYEIYENYNNMGVLGFRLIGDATRDGDVNITPDPDVHREDHLIGRVVMSSYSLGRFLMFVHEHFLSILKYAMIILAALFLLKVFISPKDRSEDEMPSAGTELQGVGF